MAELPMAGETKLRQIIMDATHPYQWPSSGFGAVQFLACLLSHPNFQKQSK